MFDPGGCSGRLRSCLFLGGWRALLRGEVRLDAGWYLRLERFFIERSTLASFSREVQVILYAVCYYGRSLSPEARRQLDWVTARSCGNCEG